MTRKEAKEIFLNRGFIDGIYDGNKWRDACIVISEWLKEEPFINKPCVSSGVCEHDKQKALDKVRAEIAEYGSIMVAYAITKDTKTDKGIEKLVSDVLKEAKEQVLYIIDKYRAESEG